MGTFIPLYSVISMTYYIKNEMEFNMIERIRKYNKLALIIDRTDDEQREMDRLEALIPNPSNCMIILLRDYQEGIERDVEHDRAMIDYMLKSYNTGRKQYKNGSSFECILQELMATLTINLKRLKEIEREYNKTS